ncbi:hypothetical protein N7478_011908 [Penicillium angulare]|uniref:uncharacterized protein n=1 Tax=Penicillium angulare TaxID=116970 RepID=UPI00253F8E99|nr:uncharacterized protein N7478_011908 [Penicillium angulare]KAJ5261313.1 hypothetical protein N7478_011908 [Penicillium angulare]
MKFQATLVAALLPLVALAAPAAENALEFAQAIPVKEVQAETEAVRRSASLEELSKRSSVSCKIINSSSAQVNCRSGPGTSYSIAGYVATGSTYTFKCYKSGSCYENNCTWDQVPLEGGGVCYVNGYYTSSACSAAALGKC